MYKNGIGVYIIVLSLLLSFSPNLTFAQEQKEATAETAENQSAQEGTSTTSETPDIQEGDVKILLDKIEVIGELEKPQAVFFIPGTNPEIDDIRIQRSFFNKIFRKVERRGRVISKIQTQPTQDRKDYIPW